jgi:hypothetical protein
VTVEILQEAQDELDAAIAYYEDIEPGLGVRLKQETRAAIEWIGKNPEAPRPRAKGYRRVNLKVFQHYIAYFIGPKQFGSLQLCTVVGVPSIG